MLCTSKTESDVILKPKGYNAFYKKILISLKQDSKHVHRNSKKVDTRKCTEWVLKRKWHKCNKTYKNTATKQSISKNKQTTKQIVTIRINKQERSHATLRVLCPWFCL